MQSQLSSPHEGSCESDWNWLAISAKLPKLSKSDVTNAFILRSIAMKLYFKTVHFVVPASQCKASTQKSVGSPEQLRAGEIFARRREILCFIYSSL